LEAGVKTCKEWMSGSQDESFLSSNCMTDNAVTDDMGLLHDLNGT